MSTSAYHARAALGPDLDLDEAETRAALVAAVARLPRDEARAVRAAILGEGDPAYGYPPLVTAALARLRQDRALLRALGRD